MKLRVFTNKIPSYIFNCCITWPAGYCISCRIAYISLNSLILTGRAMLLPVVFQEPWQAVVNPKNER